MSQCRHGNQQHQCAECTRAMMPAHEALKAALMPDTFGPPLRPFDLDQSADPFPPGHLGDYMVQVRTERDRYRKALDEIAGIGSTTAILSAIEGLHRARTIAISATK